MKKLTKDLKNNSYNSPELDSFLALEETPETAQIRASMMLAAQIDDAMRAKGLNKKQLAELLGKKPSVITKWLSGTHNFEINTLVDIENALDIKVFAFDVQHIIRDTIILEASLTIHVKYDFNNPFEGNILKNGIGFTNGHYEAYA